MTIYLNIRHGLTKETRDRIKNLARKEKISIGQLLNQTFLQLYTGNLLTYCIHKSTLYVVEITNYLKYMHTNLNNEIQEYEQPFEGGIFIVILLILLGVFFGYMFVSHNNSQAEKLVAKIEMQ